jgi:hypothetical protein
MHVTGHVGHIWEPRRGQECARKVVVAAASTGLPPDLETGGLVYLVPGHHVLARLLLEWQQQRGRQTP